MARTVFLNYRREDTSGYAGRLYDWLNGRFPNRIFTDVGKIAPGDDFVVVLEKAIGECSVLVALIGKQWLSGGRLQDPHDFVRMEIATALRRRIRVIPVLVGGGSLPDGADLPVDLAGLRQRQAIVLSDADWEAGCERLVRVLENDLGSAHKQPNRSRRTLIGAALAVMLALSAALYIYRPKIGGPAVTDSKSPPAEQQVTSASSPKEGSRLVGTWETKVVELGTPVHITWHIWPDGTSSYLMDGPSGRMTMNTRWTYSGGIIYERSSDGPAADSSAPSSASIQWMDDDHFVLTIIDNGDPGTRGLKRHYSRL